MALSGYSLPLSPEGRASLVPAPPWHYVGDFIVLEYWADPDAVRAVLPPGLEPHPDDPGRPRFRAGPGRDPGVREEAGRDGAPALVRAGRPRRPRRGPRRGVRRDAR